MRKIETAQIRCFVFLSKIAALLRDLRLSAFYMRLMSHEVKGGKYLYS
jgi:hypothetical protein